MTRDLLQPNSSSMNFGVSIQETFLQEIDPGDEDLLDAEFATHLCCKLAFSAPSPWRHRGYGTLTDIYQTDTGKKSLEELDELIRHLANKVFGRWVVQLCKLHGTYYVTSQINEQSRLSTTRNYLRR
jgi:hypothetical protein